MRCKRHPNWAGAGVCADCLRQRLAALALAQERSDALSGCAGDAPGSVSPYAQRRSAGAASDTGHRLFYSTPQVGPLFGCRRGENGRRSAFASIFRSRSDAAASWFSNLLRGRRGKKSRLFSLEEDASESGGGYSETLRSTFCRGMSPAGKGKESPAGKGKESPAGKGGESPAGKGGESPGRRCWSESPARFAKPAAGRRAAGYGRSASSIAFCLSPLVRPCPAAVDSPAFGRPHIGASASLAWNRSRSRKLADFGKLRCDGLGLHHL